MSEKPFLQLERVGKLYAPEVEVVPALDDVTLEFAEREFAAITGPSGSGKSTLLTVLGAMNEPTRGRVLVDGIDVYGLGDERRADFRHEYLGFVFQQHHLMPYLTALDNVALPLVVSQLSSREKRERAVDALARVGLGDKHDRLPSQLSGGEQARVAIARAIVNAPPLVLADEPTGNLDSATGRIVLDLLGELNAAGQTVLVVTHDEQIASAAARRVHLVDGRVVSDSRSEAADAAEARRAPAADAALVEERRGGAR